MSFLRAAISRIAPRLVFLECTGILVLLAAGLLWLKIPDSHVWQLVLSVLLGLLIASGALATQTYILQRLRRTTASHRLWLGSLLLGAWLLILALLMHAANRLEDHVSERAGYWNSRLGSHLRTALTYNRLIHWQEDVITFLLWVVVPALLLPFLVESVSRAGLRSGLENALRLLKDWRHWAAVLVLLGLVRGVTPALVYWHPVDSIHGELLSALFRLPVALVLTVLLLLILFAIESELLARHDALRHTIPEPLV